MAIRLSDEEQAAFLKQYGDPMTVARRYHQTSQSLTIGWELIGPELFPMYRIILMLSLGLAVPTVAIILLVMHVPLSLQAFVVPVVSQIVVVTIVFILLNLIRRKFPQPWYYPPAELAPMIAISRWYSLAGLVMWGVVGLWWLLIPRYPALIIGAAAKHLELAPSWQRFYVPVLLLIAASMLQRVLNLFRPNWIALLPLMRMVINAAAVPVLYFLLFKSQPLVVVATGQDAAKYEQLALATNGSLAWGTLGPWIWIYAGFSALVYAWYLRPHVRRWLRRGEPKSVAVLL